MGTSRHVVRIQAPRLWIALFVSLSIAVLSGESRPAFAGPSEHVIYGDSLNWDNWSWSTVVDEDVSSPLFSGNRSLGVTYTKGWAGLSLHTPALHTSPYTTLRFGINLGGRSLSSIKVSLYDEGGAYIKGVDPASYATPTTAGWLEVSIPLSALHGANRAITRVQFQESTGSAQPTFYLDAIRLANGTGEGIKQAHVYADSLNWADWSWGTSVDPAVASPVFAGTHSLSVTFKQGWGGLSLHHPGFDTSPYTALSFAVRPNGQSLSAISVSLYDNAGTQIKAIGPALYATPAGNGWHTVTIPLRVLNAEGRTVTRVQLQEWTGGALPPFLVDEIRFVNSEPAPPQSSLFRVAVLPDTQKYAQSYPHIFQAQTRWIADNAASHSIRFVMHLGDIVQHWDSPEEWQRADAAMDILDESAIPYSVVPGNADHAGHSTNGASTLYNSFFGVTRFSGKSWYAGNYRGNDNSYQLLTIGSERYLFMSLDWCPSSDEIAWANGVLSSHPDRRAILATHGFINDAGGRSGITFCGDTTYIWNDLVKKHANLQIVLSGHMHTDDGEAYRVDLNSAGKPVHQMLSNYQDYANGGDGWLRILEFDRAAGRVFVKTYSPYRGDYIVDSSSEFSFAYP